VAAALDVLACVAAGLRAPLGPHHKALLLDALLPLYRRVPSRVSCPVYDALLTTCSSLHRRVRGVVPDTAPPRAALSALAEPLRRCVCALVSRSPDWSSLAAGAISAAWPPPAEAAAAKGELLLEAVEELVAAAGPRAGAAALSAALPAFSAALRRHHAGSAERAAAALAAPGVLAAARAQPAAALGALVPLLVGDARKHWSRDVDAARHRALTALRVRCLRVSNVYASHG
jgi:hypothetical protein